MKYNKFLKNNYLILNIKMGNGCGKTLTRSQENYPHNTNKAFFDSKMAIRKFSNINTKSGLIINQYSVFKYKNKNFQNRNMLMFTYHDCANNQFIIVDNEYNESIRFNTFKDNGVAIGYSKGNKIDCFIQDKFFAFMDGNIQVFCLIDGHGPYGNVVAQIIQDKIFQEIIDTVYNTEFEYEYKTILETIFANTQSHLLKCDEKTDLDYDCYLSGGVVTLVVVKDNILYCANVGNISACLFFTERFYSFKFNIIELSTDHSAKMSENCKSKHSSKLKINDKNNNETDVYSNNQTKIKIDISNKYLNKAFDKFDETRRIYESGGEIRQLAGEDQSRIFVKGKYYPAIITTRSIGDEIASQIGVKSEPHITCYKLNDKIEYNLLICTDGISNVMKLEDIVSVIENNDNLFLESINQTMQQAKNEYPKNSYTPDMTILLKCINKQ